MINIFSTRNINIISLIITIIILLIINLFINNFSDAKTIEDEKEKIISEKIEEENNVENNEEKNIQEKCNWYIEIPSINLVAPIAESVESEVLKTSVGHFEETATEVGNIGLAGHNRGYEKNYFENLKNVKEGDEIKYKYNGFEKTYVIDKIKIIKNTDWSYLENTEKNKITLITCVENEPDYRRCVQATEKE